MTSNCAEPSNVHVEGYLWGADTAKLTQYLPSGETRFDTLILADLLFNHSEHRKLLSTILQTLRKGANSQALVFFTPYRPHLFEADMAFFPLCTQAGLRVEKVLETKMEKVMFPEDKGDEKLRRTVFGYCVTWDEGGGRAGGG